MPEPGRRAAHVLLDAVSVHDLDTPDQVNTQTMNLALALMEETGAVTATLNDETEEVTVHYSNLIGRRHDRGATAGQPAPGLPGHRSGSDHR